MTLQEFIDEMGSAKFAERFRLSRRTVESYRQRRRVPRPTKAAEIIRRSKGRVTWEGIYGTRRHPAAESRV